MFALDPSAPLGPRDKRWDGGRAIRYNLDADPRVLSAVVAGDRPCEEFALRTIVAIELIKIPAQMNTSEILVRDPAWKRDPSFRLQITSPPSHMLHVLEYPVRLASTSSGALYLKAIVLLGTKPDYAPFPS
jgi:hypothetical protein